MRRDKIQKVVRETVQQIEAIERPYSGTYAVLRIVFAEGSEPQAIDIPYRPFQNREEVRLPYRLVKP